MDQDIFGYKLDRRTILIQGDSAFGFNGLEYEVIHRYKLPVYTFVFNNGGMYPEIINQQNTQAAARRKQAAEFVDVTDNSTGMCYEKLCQIWGGDENIVSFLIDSSTRK